MKNYKPLQISFDSGKGCYLYTDSKEEYLDAISGIGVCGIGHSHQEISKVIASQSKKLIHVSNLFQIKNQEELANKLCKISKMKSAFFCNSGSEANEAAIKLARLHANNKKFGWYPPNIKDITKSFKIKYFHLNHNNEISKSIDQFIKYKTNAVLHVNVSSNVGVIDHSDEKLQSIFKF